MILRWEVPLRRRKPNNATERMIQMISSIAEFLQNVNSEKLAAAVEDDSLPQGEFEEIRL